MNAARSRFRLLVFDWDGTLIDSTGSIVAATMAAVADLGVAGPDADEVLDCIGLSPRESFERLFPEASAEDAQRLADSLRPLTGRSGLRPAP